MYVISLLGDKSIPGSYSPFDDSSIFQKYAVAINAKGRPFPTEPLIMALLLEQHKVINWLQKKIPLSKQRFFKFFTHNTSCNMECLW